MADVIDKAGGVTLVLMKTALIVLLWLYFATAGVAQSIPATELNGPTPSEPEQVIARLLVWALWLPRGKDILFVYSDSPIWHDYMATQVLPLVQRQNFFLDIPLQELGQQLLSNQQTGLAKFLAPVTPPLAQSTAFIELIDL